MLIGQVRANIGQMPNLASIHASFPVASVSGCCNPAMALKIRFVTFYFHDVSLVMRVADWAVRTVVIATFFASFLLAGAQTTGSQSTIPTGGLPCLVDLDRDVVPDCIQKAPNGKLIIAPQYVKELHFDSRGLASVWSEVPPKAWMYVDRKGAVLVTGVPGVDNGPDDFSEGLVRTVVGDKYGFANRRGNLVIKPAYDWAAPFHDGNAEVCNKCRKTCLLSDSKMVDADSMPGGCDHWMMTGGEWFKVNKKGRIVSRLVR